MNKHSSCAVLAVTVGLVCAQTAAAQMGYPYAAGYGWGAGAWFWMAIASLVYMAVVFYVFAYIFWMVGKKTIEKLIDGRKELIAKTIKDEPSKPAEGAPSN